MTACDTLPPPPKWHNSTPTICLYSYEIVDFMEFCNSITILHGILYTLSKIILNFVSTKKHIIKI